MKIQKTTLPLVACLLMGCASSYRPVVTQTVDYSSETGADGVYMLYDYGVLGKAGNKKYAGKEIRSGVRIVAVEIANETNEPLIFNEDVALYTGDQPVKVLTPEEVKKEIRQVPGLYMLWSLFWVVISKCEEGDCSVIPLPVGFVIGLGNMGKAKKANENFMNDLKRYNLLGKTIEPGETVNGLIGIQVGSEQPLRIVTKGVN